jgi:hypothetical protein
MQNDIRTIERYAQDIVAAELRAPLPRRFKTSVVVLHAPAPRLVVFFGVIACLLLYQEFSYYSSQTPRGVAYYVITIFGLCVSLYTLFHDILWQIYRWWYALRYGHATIARIVTLQERRLNNATGWKGQWQFSFEGTTYTAHFRIDDVSSGTWIRQLRIYDDVHVLTHSHTPRVFVALGNVHKEGG